MSCCGGKRDKKDKKGKKGKKDKKLSTYNESHEHHGRASSGASIPLPRSASQGSHSNEEQPMMGSRIVKIHNPKGFPRSFADVLSEKDIAGLNKPLKWGKMDKYIIFTDKVLGKGSYGEVFKAERILEGDECVAKKMVFKASDDKEKILQRLQLEVNIMKQLRGCEDILQIWDIVKDDSGSLYIICEYINSPSYTKTFKKASPDVVQFYLYHHLKAIDYCHSKGVVHRDVKGDNCLFDPEKMKFRLIDFGLSDFFIKGQDTTKFPGSLVYKAPELFLEYTKFDYAVDMWAFGCVMAGIIFQKLPHFFLPDLDDDGFEKEGSRERRGRYAYLQIREIALLLGTDDFAVYCYKYRDTLRQKVRQRYSPQQLIKDGCPRERKPLTSLRNSKNKDLATAQAIDVVEKIFVYDHETRLTAREALKHPYFAKLRKTDTAPAPSPPRSLSSSSSAKSIMVTSDSNIVESGEFSGAAFSNPISASASEAAPKPKSEKTKSKSSAASS
jgi:casein kinase II subunit alpha